MLPAYNFYPNNDLLDPSYPYLEHTYLPLHFRDPVRLPTPVPDADLSFTPISQQLIYPTARRVHLFPTPSELLSNISHRRQSCPRDISEPRPTSRQQSPDADTSAAPLNTSVTKTESQRKARQRAIAEEIGFTPTDPDTISSHEKKRHYLECLEQYVLYLHDQLRLVQTEPLALERVSTYRGLSSRSIRTLLVHMQNTNKTLHEGTLVEEQVFLDLSAQVMTAHNAGLPLRRHSVDIAGMSRHTGYNPNLTPFDQTSSFPLDDMTASGSPSSADGSSASPDTSTDLATQRFLFPSAGDGM
ncbi:hypothetical protein EV363DRAFT_1426621 [Boletus edulis]|nr:hypothetical protein EV363DRAFT_1426621 [Boletus edulis]